MYQRYFDADPEQRAPPIPTAFVRSPGSKATQQLLCDSKDRNAAPHVMDDIMLRLFKGVLEYERSIKAAPGRLKRVTELSGGVWHCFTRSLRGVAIRGVAGCLCLRVCVLCLAQQPALNTCC